MRLNKSKEAEWEFERKPGIDSRTHVFNFSTALWKWELGQCLPFPHFLKTHRVSSNYPLSFPFQSLLTFSHSTPQHVHIEREEGKLGVIISNQRQSPHLPCSHHIPGTECWIHCLFINKTGKNIITQYILFGFLFAGQGRKHRLTSKKTGPSSEGGYNTLLCKHKAEECTG